MSTNLYAMFCLVISVIALMSCDGYEPQMPSDAKSWVVTKTLQGDSHQLETGDYGFVADVYLDEACERLAEREWVELREEDVRRVLKEPMVMTSGNRWFLVRAVTGFSSLEKLVTVTIYDPPAIETCGSVRDENGWIDLRQYPVIVALEHEPLDVSVAYEMIFRPVRKTRSEGNGL